MSKSLWDFSAELYARSGVADCCLRLQDEQGADVCLLLAALWLERRGVAATTERIARLERLATPWQAAVTAPLRELRRAWKSAAAADAELAALRQSLLELELQAERLLLERLQAAAGAWPSAAATAKGNWLECLQSVRAAADSPPGRAALQALRDAAALTQP